MAKNGWNIHYKLKNRKEWMNLFKKKVEKVRKLKKWKRRKKG
jgi:hypothetical protein